MIYKGQSDQNLNQNMEKRRITHKEIVEATLGRDSMLCGLAPDFSHPIKFKFLKFKGSEYPMTWSCKLKNSLTFTA